MSGIEVNSRMGAEAIIIGAGPAGLSAALWCADLGIEALVLERRPEIGGQLLWIHNAVKNHLGSTAQNGRELRDRLAAQLATFATPILLNSAVAKADLTAGRIWLESGAQHEARFIIIATGLRRKRLNIPGEREFEGRGVAISATRDLDSFSGKRVCIIGGGDGAVENALMIAEVGARVTLVHRRAELRARRQFIERLHQKPNIELITEAVALRILGEQTVKGLEIERRGVRLTLPTDAVLIRIGFAPNTELFREQLELDAQGYVRVNRELETTIENVFAIGDISNPSAPTISGAIGDGATVAKVIAERMRHQT